MKNPAATLKALSSLKTSELTSLSCLGFISNYFFSYFGHNPSMYGERLMNV